MTTYVICYDFDGEEHLEVFDDLDEAMLFIEIIENYKLTIVRV